MLIIYKATNLINNKIYIGQTINSLKQRKSRHIYESDNGCDYCLHRAIRKYGANNFKWEVLCCCFTIDGLNEMEVYFIALYDSFENGYNLTSGGLNFIRSEESKKKMSDNHADFSGENHPMYDKRASELAKENNRIAQLGKKLSEEHKKKISKALNGKNHPMYGRHHSDETKKLMSKNHVGMLDKRHSAETRKKMVIAWRTRRIREKMFNSPIIQLSLFKS